MDSSQNGGRNGPAVRLLALVFGFLLFFLYMGIKSNHYTTLPTTEQTVAKQRVEQKFASAKPGDLMIAENGTVCVLGQGRPFAVREFSYSLEVNYVCGFSWSKPNERFVTEKLDGKSTIAHIGEPTHKDASACFVQGLKFINGSCSQ